MSAIAVAARRSSASCRTSLRIGVGASVWEPLVADVEVDDGAAAGDAAGEPVVAEEFAEGGGAIRAMPSSARFRREPQIRRPNRPSTAIAAFFINRVQGSVGVVARL